MKTLTPTGRRTVPRSALRFTAAAVTMNDQNFAADPDAAIEGQEPADDEAAEGSPPPPKAISIRARTNGVANHGYWGRCIHDFAGFVPPTGPVPLDWNHQEDADIGVADSLTVDADGLLAAGRLIPFTANDRAAELIYKGAQGVPYQASIVMDLETLIVTEVPEGQRYTVNGQDVEGPLTVFSQWTIDGISILPYGADPSTMVEFSRGTAGEIDVAVIRQPVQEVQTVDTNDKKEPVAPPATAGQFSRDEALKFKTDFGAKGFDWYLEGKTYAEAAKLFGADLQTQIDALKTDLAAKDATIATLTTERDELKAKAEFRRGHTTPATTKSEGDDKTEEKPDPSKFGRSPEMNAFTNAIEKRLAKQVAENN